MLLLLLLLVVFSLLLCICLGVVGGCQGVAIWLLCLLLVFSLLSCSCCGYFEWFPGLCSKVTVDTFYVLSRSC